MISHSKTPNRQPAPPPLPPKPEPQPDGSPEADSKPEASLSDCYPRFGRGQRLVDVAAQVVLSDLSK